MQVYPFFLETERGRVTHILADTNCYYATALCSARFEEFSTPDRATRRLCALCIQNLRLLLIPSGYDVVRKEEHREH